MAQRCSHCASISFKHLIQLARTEFSSHTFPRQAFQRHHASFRELDASADAGCDLCRLIIECFKSTSYSGLERIDIVPTGQALETNSMYWVAMELDESDVKIAIDSSHLYNCEPIEKVSIFDLLLVQLGPMPPLDEVGSDEEFFPELRLTLNVARGIDSPCLLDGYHIGRLDVDSDLGSVTNYEIVRHWLSECRNLHHDCLKTTLPQLPTRVIDVQLNQTRIIHSEDTKAEYVALSHCWGGRIDSVLTAETQQQYQRELPFHSLPANFQDAITITRELGVQYLWIDSLCIQQDSKSDWEKESKKMGTVYRDALVTVYAMSSSRSTDGILRSAPVTTQTPQPVVMNVSLDNGLEIAVRIGYYDPNEETLNGLGIKAPLALRGWTLQEALLSPRHLYYGRHQIYWKCPQGYQALDGMPSGFRYPEENMLERLSSFLYLDILQNPWPLNNEVKADILHGYYWMIREYSSRSLTYDSDKLPAISGLVQRLHGVLGGDYIAGLWSGDLVSQLCWYKESLSCKHVEQYRAPSWSWAITNDPVIIDEPLLPCLITLEILEYEVVPCNERNPYGEIQSAHILVNGLTIPILRSRQVFDGSDLPAALGFCDYDEPEVLDGTEINRGYTTPVFSATNIRLGVEAKCLLTIGMTVRPSPDLQLPADVDDNRISDQDYIALLVSAAENTIGEDCTIKCLVLKESKINPNRVPSEYERVGLISLTCSANLVRDWKRQVIKLV
ncbi:hypothetical protein ACMFMG_009606 [Clarireedia jacksonii]